MRALSNIPLLKGEYGRVAGDWSPADLANNNLWLREDTTITSSPDIDAWLDNVGSNDATQATAAAKPHLVAGGMNGHDEYLFDGTDDFLDTGLTFESLVQSEVSIAISIAVRIPDGQPASAGVFFGSQRLTGPGRDVFNGFLSTDGTLRFGYNENGSGIFSRTSSAAFANGDAGDNIITFHWDFPGAAINIRLNGSSLAMTSNDLSPFDPSANYNQTQNWFIGANNLVGADTSHFNIALSEFVVYTAGAGDIDNIESYMAKRYAI